MASKRASVKGKGMDILFGGTSEEAVLPGVSVKATAKPAPNDGGLTPEMESLLDEEAMAGGPGLAAVEEAGGPILMPSKKELAYVPPKAERPAEPVIPDWATSRPPTEERAAEPAVAPVEAKAKEEPPPPPSIVPTTTAPPTAEAAAVPPPKEKPEAEAYDLKIRGLLYDALSLAGGKAEEEAPGPGAGAAKEAPPPEVGPEAQPSPLRTQEEVLEAVGRRRLEALEKQIDELFSSIPDELYADPERDIALALLRDAQDIVQERPRQYDLAMFKIGQVKMMVRRRQSIVQETRTHGYPLMAWEFGWFILFLAGIVFRQPLASWLLAITNMTLVDFTVNLQPMLGTLMWGGIGGVVGGLWSLWKHVARDQDFNKQHTMWYLVQPIMGIILGGVIHLLFMAGVLVVQASSNTTAAFWFPSLVACLVGFRQNYAYAWLDSVARLIGRDPQAQEEGVVAAAPAAAAPAGETAGLGA